MARYNYPEIAELARELTFAPAAVRRTELECASNLIDSLGPGDTFTFDSVCFRITGYRPARQGGRVFVGRLLADDLRELLVEVSESLRLKAASFGEPVYSIADLKRLFAVAPTTVARWRRLGLKAFKFIFPDGTKRLGFTAVFISQFVRSHAEARSRFRWPGHAPEALQKALVAQARVLAREGVAYDEVQRRLASKFALQPAAVRRIVELHDRSHPGSAVFPVLAKPPKARECKLMYDALKAGFRVDDIAAIFDRPCSVVRRAILRHKAHVIAERPIEFVGNELFDHPDADRIILAPAEGPAAEYRREVRQDDAGDDPEIPAFARQLRRLSLLTPERERYLFRKYNYLKYKIARLRRELDMGEPALGHIHRLEELYHRAEATRNEIIRANVRLVASIARRHVTLNVRLSDLISEGNVSLMKAVEKFDYARGNRFSTYATWAIYKNFAKTVPAGAAAARRFVTGQEQRLAQAQSRAPAPPESAQRLPSAHEVVQVLLACLSERERTVIMRRFALEPGVRASTLSELGRELDITRERIRQIEHQALAKMRKAAGTALTTTFA